MKESNTLAGNATIKQHQKEILLDTKGQYMKVSNTLVYNATIKQHKNEILLDTKGKYMKVSNTLACIVARNLLPGQISQGTIEMYIQVIIFYRDKKFVHRINKDTAKRKRLCMSPSF